ncbi:4Fe-4S single cluster domain-containing protein [Actinomadura sp. 9N215]|uniref:4Fe-4S single cluster domain-containing protein n=1 Tax=Actinomadura sp. 9N215 TaxID=3375150 RepID=UPI0037BB1E6F
MTTAKIRVNRMHHPVTALGFGRRLGIWFQGCPLACAGCMSKDTWEPDGGAAFTVPELAELWRGAVRKGADGLTITGGEPLAQPDGLAALLAAASEIRAESTAPGGPAAGREIDVLLYTGLTEDEFDPAAVAGADALITGRFEITNPTGLIWRGSGNQRLLPRTDLGLRRYRPYLEHVPEHPPLQVATDGLDVHLIGVPRQGMLPSLERALRSEGTDVGGATWRHRRTRD